MTTQTRNEVLYRVLEFARATSFDGDGLSIRDALSRSGYVENRAKLLESDLASILSNEPDLANTWVQYSEDKRTSGGWYVDRDTLSIGTLEDPDDIKEYTSLPEAVAAYVLVELDYWVSVNAA
jgi:hypothetical protein